MTHTFNTQPTIKTELDRLRNTEVQAILHAGNMRVMIKGQLIRPSNQKWFVVVDDASVSFDPESVTMIRLENIPEIYLA
jgi:hypothetical protein